MEEEVNTIRSEALDRGGTGGGGAGAPGSPETAEGEMVLDSLVVEVVVETTQVIHLPHMVVKVVMVS